MARRFEFALATDADDGELCALLRQIAMPGNMTLAFLREPSFFLAEQAGSTASQVIICRDRQQGLVVGMGSRSLRCVYIDGQPTSVGYLSMLRGTPQARGSIGLARGYQYLKELHTDGLVPYYFTTILADNADAVRLLTSGRAGLPTYQPVARLITYLIPLTSKRRWQATFTGVSRGERGLLPQALTCLQEWNSRYQFAPVYTLQDLLGQSRMLPGFSWEHLYTYREQERVLGTLGVWDQQAFKQTVVTAYSQKMQLLRPWYNLYAYARGIPRLPRAGASIPVLYAAFTSGDRCVFVRLLRQACADWSGQGYDYLSVGFCTDNACSAVAARYATQRIASTVYLVSWPASAVVLPQTDWPVHLEIATL
ncbi:MAG TPA: hypothetical protein VGF67_19285 [Ktedonobacteraceae bacterium]|jgi:hypothetical protein